MNTLGFTGLCDICATCCRGKGEECQYRSATQPSFGMPRPGVPEQSSLTNPVENLVELCACRLSDAC